ncbi:hypothetical protein V496_00581 [Pseudogymnoascus sp. VKM F-4515 (FW-2607)]|nr:hypothetical protein V496_00581 [Pseudogymnoascus sp. VKM F-4515 (FW-2607)]
MGFAWVPGKLVALGYLLLRGSTRLVAALGVLRRCRKAVKPCLDFGSIDAFEKLFSAKSFHHVQTISRKLFSLSYEEKMVAKHPPKSNPNRGYSYVGQENTVILRGYKSGLGPGKTRDVKRNHSTWEPTTMNSSLIHGMRTFKTELNILSALARALGIPDVHLTSLHSRAENEFRLLHYPTVPLAEFKNGTATRIAEHTDFVQSLRYSRVPQADCACHRVTFPPTIKGDNDDEMLPERYSVAYFAKATYNDSLLPLKGIITEATPCRYKEDITAWEWNNLRIGNLYR